MASIVLKIKNMVCQRCVMTVEGILKNLSIPFQKVEVGEIHFEDIISEGDKTRIREQLERIGLGLIDSHSGNLVESIKKLVINKARNEVTENEQKLKLSSFLTSRLHHEYTYLSSLFSDIEGRTIENYFIMQRIEKAKELLVYGQLSLNDIAFELNYSSAAHLSNQFKKITGLTPSHFKQIGATKRKALDQV